VRSLPAIEKQMKDLINQVEGALAEKWGDAVYVAEYQSIQEHHHVTRLKLENAHLHMPKTVILKRWRNKDDERYDPELSKNHFFNEWASLQFLSEVLGSETPAPKIIVGDQTSGFLVIEDLPGDEPLSALFGNDPEYATDKLIGYAESLARLHGKTLGRFDTFHSIRHKLNESYVPEIMNYFEFFEKSQKTLERVGVTLSQKAIDDVKRIAEIFTLPGEFLTFTHGDPVFSNYIECQGKMKFIDFEASRFRHALWEGVYPRMIFPTSGLNKVFRIPESVWRQVEARYRTEWSKYCSLVTDQAKYNSGIAAMCGGWILAFCQGHLSIETAVTSSASWVNQLRQRVLARVEMFVRTSKEYQNFIGLGEVFEAFLSRCRSQWPDEADHLPFYPAFAM
jgi:tRNA A-37 threonylcarbamoyl transferase component Bud32